jgi:hypothetical protein
MYRLVARHAPEIEPDIPAPKAAPSAAQLNAVVQVLVFEDDRGRMRKIDLTVSMMQRAEKMNMAAEDYAAGLLAFNDRLVA